MNFTRFDSSKLRLNNSIRVYAHSMPIGREAYRLLGEPKRIIVYYDTQAEAIKLEASENDGYKVSIKPAPHISIKLSSVMPIGRYIATPGNVFVLLHPTNQPQIEGESK